MHHNVHNEENSFKTFYTYENYIFVVKITQMDSKITMAFDSEVIEKAKAFALQQNISLSRLTEFLYRQIVSGNYTHMDDFPIADWVQEVSEPESTYTKAKSRKQLKSEYLKTRK